MSSVLRRRRENYSLPSESIDILNRMIGRSIRRFAVGMRSASGMGTAEFAESKLEDILHRALGMPYFLSLERGKTIVLYDDDFLGSIVLREIGADIDSPDFLEVLEQGDRVGDRMRVRELVDIDELAGCAGVDISSVSIFKLPDNYHYKPTGYDKPIECVIRLALNVGGELLFAGQIKGGVGFPNIRLMSWEVLDHAERDRLSRVWSSA